MPRFSRSGGIVAILITHLQLLAAEPIGLDAITQWDRLPEIRDAARTCQASSHDPSGGNGDTGEHPGSPGIGDYSTPDDASDVCRDQDGRFERHARPAQRSRAVGS